MARHSLIPSLLPLLVAGLLTAACTRPDTLASSAAQPLPAAGETSSTTPSPAGPQPGRQAGNAASPVLAPATAGAGASGTNHPRDSVSPPYPGEPARPHGARPGPSPRTLLPPASGPSPATAALAREVQALIGDATCETAAECRALPFGNRPCGGPERYLPYSIRVTDPARIEALAARHADARRAEDAARGAVSTCIALLPPQATCKERRCVLQAAPDALPVR